MTPPLEQYFVSPDPTEHPGLVLDGTCRASGLRLWTRPEWNIDTPTYGNRIQILTRDIIVFRSRGKITAPMAEIWRRNFDRMIAEFTRDGRRLVVIEDWTQYLGADTSSRRAYIQNLFAHKHHLTLLAFHSASPLMKLFVRLGQKIHPISIPVEVHPDLVSILRRTAEIRKQAWPLALDGSTASESSGGPFAPLARLFARFSGRKNTLDSYAKELQEVFASLPWDSAEEAPNPLAQNHPFREVVDSWLAVKKDLEFVQEMRRQQERQFREIVETAQEGIWMADLDLHTTWMNERMVALLGLEPWELAAARLDRILPAWRLRRSRTLSLLRHGRSTSFEVPLERPDGSVVWMIVSASPRRGEDGSAEGIFAMCTDITDRRRAEAEIHILARDLENRVRLRTRELEESNRDLATALRSREEFLAAMSHELRTPLASILNVAESLRSRIWGPVADAQDQKLSILEANGKHLLSLIEDILDVSKGQAGKLKIVREPVDIAKLANDCIATVEMASRKKGVSLSVEMQPDLGTVTGDPRRLRQILLNLLSNAIKFTPPASAAGLVATCDPDNSLLRLSIWDEGPGIAPHDQSKLFQPFVQLDNRLSRQHGGTGLGLSLAMHLAHLHGGRIELESAVGIGSKFVVILPWQRNTGAAPEAPVVLNPEQEPTDAGWRRILVVEDNPDLRLTTAEYLEANGYLVTTAESGRKALEALEATRYSAVLMDIQMPDMDGFETIRRARQIPLAAGTPIVAMTGLAFPEDVKRCKDAGADVHLAKPVQLRKLRETLERLTA